MATSVPLLDLKAQYATIKDEINAAVADVFESQYFILGPQVTALEERIATYCNCPAAVGVGSGSDALLVALMALDVGPDDEVITSPYTFFATGGSIARTGARPVFVDIDPVTYNMDPERIEEAITARTKVIMPVHLFGQMAAMKPIMKLARTHKLDVVEDACQAIGAERNGQRAGSVGDLGCFSFFPSKNLGGAGEGGMIVCRDTTHLERLRRLRVHGGGQQYVHEEIGGNFRLDAIQAAVVNVKLNHLDQWTGARQENAKRYNRLFTAADLTDDPGIILPSIVADRHIFNQYVIRAPRRDELRQFLLARNVGCSVYYPIPLHLQECFAYLGYEEGDLPESERAAKETLALPVYPELSEEQAVYVVDQIAAFYRE